MTHQASVESVVREELRQTAPEIDWTQVDPDAGLFDEFDIDSMDFLNLITRIGRRLSRTMPESDYDKMQTVGALVQYLTESPDSADSL